MTCSMCKSKSHNKRKCPYKNKATELQSQPKKSRGRPRTVRQPEEEIGHDATTAQPSRIGRGGRVIHDRGFQAARGGQESGKSVSRRGKGKVPVGFGVIIDGQGNAWTNSPGQQRGPVNISHTSTCNSGAPTTHSV
ncbi:unnamed protein product [Cuscuta epithymum]|uniref:Uncharacterized protein n=1 Tax=Cuscuta epithymum TaxID=186058 RepID=A0AAV0DXX5_9ASTE|nr:unnamed protein product [Cuscuta epithymum]